MNELSFCTYWILTFRRHTVLSSYVQILQTAQHIREGGGVGGGAVPPALQSFPSETLLSPDRQCAQVRTSERGKRGKKSLRERKWGGGWVGVDRDRGGCHIWLMPINILQGASRITQWGSAHRVHSHTEAWLSTLRMTGNIQNVLCHAALAVMNSWLVCVFVAHTSERAISLPSLYGCGFEWERLRLLKFPLERKMLFSCYCSVISLTTRRWR